jgi:hypothetical protein
MTVPLFIPGIGWRLEVFNGVGELLGIRDPNDEETVWLAKHPVEASNLRAEFELLQNRRRKERRAGRF